MGFPPMNYSREKDICEKMLREILGAGYWCELSSYSPLGTYPCTEYYIVLDIYGLSQFVAFPALIVKKYYIRSEFTEENIEEIISKVALQIVLGA
jgi:hypothetical protein